MNAMAQATAAPNTGAKLSGRTFAFLIPGDGAGQAETLQPRDAVALAGGRAVLVSPDEGVVGAHPTAHLTGERGYGMHVPVDELLSEVDPAEFDALVLPGGVTGPDVLSQDSAALRFLTAFYLAGKPIAAECRAPRLLLEADLVRDRMLTSTPYLSEAVEEAGGSWYDEPVVVCHNGPNVLLTGRTPEDLDAYCDTLVDEFAAALTQRGPHR